MTLDDSKLEADEAYFASLAALGALDETAPILQERFNAEGLRFDKIDQDGIQSAALWADSEKQPEGYFRLNPETGRYEALVTNASLVNDAADISQALDNIQRKDAELAQRLRSALIENAYADVTF